MEKTFETKILEPTANNIKLCAKHLKNSGVVAFATETVFGLGANIFDEIAVKKIFEIKNRPADNPLIVHIADISEINKLALDISDDFYKLADYYMPGPLTVVLKKHPSVPDVVTAGQDTVAIRIPRCTAALDLIKECGFPLCAPSANTSTRPSPTKAEHVYDDLNGKIPYILHSDIYIKYGIESTIVDLTTDTPKILRLGIASAEKISELLDKDVIIAKNHTVATPGSKYRHYAPLVPLYYLPITNYKTKLDELYKAQNSIIFCNHEIALQLGKYNLVDMGDVYDYARDLYAQLRIQEKNYSQIIAIGVEDQHSGRAVNNRLIKAAGTMHNS